MSILREITAEKHRKVEDAPFVQYLLKGNITKEHYVVYLYEMIYIYDRLESLASKAGLLEGLDGLARTKRIVEDLEELDPEYQSILTDSTFDYLAYLNNLYNSDRKNDLFAHIYVRHLGDMYGGKLISRVVPGSGKWYEFDNRPELVKAFNNKLSLDHADEALVAFGYFENIFNDLWLKIHK